MISEEDGGGLHLLAEEVTDPAADERVVVTGVGSEGLTTAQVIERWKNLPPTDEQRLFGGTWTSFSNSPCERCPAAGRQALVVLQCPA